MGISIHKNLKQKENIITYGIKNIKADLNVTRIVIKAMTEISLSYLNKTYSFNFPLWGEHNIYNLLASLGALLLQNYDLNDVIPHISKLKSIEGRFEVLHKNQKGQPQVIVDYAHTPDALGNILKTLKVFKSKSIILIFGCGGDRDQGKRSEMAKVAKVYADYIIVTSDNPRFEDPKKIMKDITDHLESNFIEIENRELAISKGIEMMNEDSILLIAGKGHEKYQDINGIKSYFSDKDTVLKKIGKKS
jgi:UDP-N-acetylmuramoyl-L-alanyl-D-glutamate--2,6-diaminopimelate ligase